jgi:hypothetical protein
VREAGAGEAERRRELVVGDEQGVRAVEDTHSFPLEAAQLPEAVVHSVKRRKDVEARENDVLWARPTAGIGRGGKGSVEPVPTETGHEQGIRLG